mmetsp:Transcript_31074/g.59031  ORF Transcript_31074/g.59031 Transcript_31074/m.59031 type:complete len:102 (-) Transcript_31074:1676-1981(-)
MYDIELSRTIQTTIIVRQLWIFIWFECITCPTQECLKNAQIESSRDQIGQSVSDIIKMTKSRILLVHANFMFLGLVRVLFEVRCFMNGLVNNYYDSSPIFT